MSSVLCKFIMDVAKGVERNENISSCYPKVSEKVKFPPNLRIAKRVEASKEHERRQTRGAKMEREALDESPARKPG